MVLDCSLATVPAGLERGSQIFGIEVRGTEVVSVGGAHHGPVVLYSTDTGRSFERWATPETLGLRGLHVDDGEVWVVGEDGVVARTTGAGGTWTRVPIASTACLYTVARDARGRYWITGDDGLVLRSTPTSTTFERIGTSTKGRVLRVFLDPKLRKPWIVDTTGTLQRFDGKRFRVIDTGATGPALNHMIRTPGGTLVIAGNEGTILRSADDGESWSRSETSTSSDLAWVAVTRYGMFACGHHSLLLVSHDDGKTFTRVETPMTGKLWTIANVDGGVLIGGDGGAIYRFAASELAILLHAAMAGRDEVIAGLASRVHERDDGAELVLADALRERGLW